MNVNFLIYYALSRVDLKKKINLFNIKPFYPGSQLVVSGNLKTQKLSAHLEQTETS